MVTGHCYQAVELKQGGVGGPLQEDTIGYRAAYSFWAPELGGDGIVFLMMGFCGAPVTEPHNTSPWGRGVSSVLTAAILVEETPHVPPMLILSSTACALQCCPQFHRSGIIFSMSFWFYGGDFPHLHMEVELNITVSDFELLWLIEPLVMRFVWGFFTGLNIIARVFVHIDTDAEKWRCATSEGSGYFHF